MLPRRSTVLARAALARRRCRRCPARAQLRIDITRPSFEPMPIAITAFVGGDARSAPDDRRGDPPTWSARACSADRPPSAFIQDDRRRQRAAALRRLAADQRPGAGQRRGQPRPAAASGSSSGCGTCSAAADAGLLLHQPAQQLAPRRAHDRRRDLQAHHRRGRLFRHPHRLCRRDRPGNARVKRLAIMDQDGANHRFLTDGAHLVLTPRFSPTPQEITYMSYREDSSAARLSLQTSTPAAGSCSAISRA